MKKWETPKLERLGTLPELTLFMPNGRDRFNLHRPDVCEQTNNFEHVPDFASALDCPS